jgi:hypothetical protein
MRASKDGLMNKSIEHVLQFFKYEHLPPRLQVVSKPFAILAKAISDGPQNPETTVALRKLLESKDAAVRAVVIGVERSSWSAHRSSSASSGPRDRNPMSQDRRSRTRRSEPSTSSAPLRLTSRSAHSCGGPSRSGRW